jgi:hypothetical protein
VHEFDDALNAGRLHRAGTGSDGRLRDETAGSVWAKRDPAEFRAKNSQMGSGILP